MRKSRIVGATGAVTALAALAIAFVGGWEGLRLHSYRDVAGVWTACYGETKAMGPGMRFTKAQCDQMLIEGLERHEHGMRRCLRNPDALPGKTYVALLSLTYNIGVGAFCGSTAARRVNGGDLPGACEALTWWNKADGREIRGLVNRRSAEYKLCMEGLR